MSHTIRVSDTVWEKVRNNKRENETTKECVDRLFLDNEKPEFTFEQEERIEEMINKQVENLRNDIINQNL